MKTIDLRQQEIALSTLLDWARQEPVLLLASDGREFCLAAPIERSLMESPQQYSSRRQSPWRHAPVIADLPHTYRSGHGRGRGRQSIEIYHTLLRFG